MDPLRALFELFRLGSRFGEARHKLAHATRTGLVIGLLMALGVMAAAVALCLLVYALDRALQPLIGEIGSALLLALLLSGLAGGLCARALGLLKTPPAPAPVPQKPEDMSTSALLALLGGIVVGTVLQARKDSKDHP